MGRQFNNDPYAQLGVSSTKKGVHEATKKMSKGLYPGAFCQVVPIAAEGLPNEVSEGWAQIIHSDGVGTKSNVAYIAAREGIKGDFWSTLAQDAIVMNIDDMLCVGVTNDFCISNHIARNSNRVDDEALAQIIQGYPRFYEKMEEMGIRMYNTGGETADVGSYTSTIGMDVTAAAVILRSKIIDCSNIAPNQYIVGLASDGKAIYETKENTGIRSNGLTLAINTLLNPYYRKYSETLDSTIPVEKLYTGEYYLDDTLKGTSLTVAESLLSPTRTYVPVIREILNNKIPVTGIVHCSGGGLTKSINFGKSILYVKDEVTKIETPPIFKEIKRLGGVDDFFMYQTFNMGIGIEVYTDTLGNAEKIIQSANKYGINAYVIGHTEVSPDGVNRVKIGPNSYSKK